MRAHMERPERSTFTYVEESRLERAVIRENGHRWAYNSTTVGPTSSASENNHNEYKCANCGIRARHYYNRPHSGVEAALRTAAPACKSAPA